MTRKDSQGSNSYGKYPLLGSVLRSTSPAVTSSLFSSSSREELVVPPPISCLTSAVGGASTLLVDLDIEADSSRSPNFLTVSCNLSTRSLLPRMAGDVVL